MCQMETLMDVPSCSNPEQQKPHGQGQDVGNALRECRADKLVASSTATPSADTGKKKRVHRAAKLKQCKMDARREQWLAKVAGRTSNLESVSHNQNDKDKQSGSWRDTFDVGSEASSRSKQVEFKLAQDGTSGADGTKHESVMSPGFGAPHVVIQDSRKHDSSDPSPQSSPGYFKRQAHINGAEGKSSDVSTWSSSEASSSQSNSSRASSSCGGSGSDDDKEVDDWEVVADALHVQASVRGDTPRGAGSQSENHAKRPTVSSSSVPKDCVLKPESRYSRSVTFSARTRGDAGRAWRPDDTSRPHTLPCLAKQHSLPLPTGSASVWGPSHGNIWGIPPAPLHCPICTEELDTTDSSFMPCPCGFRLCLFCHHRIVLGDGRCPGCRKSYNTQVVTKLSRTSSVRSRV